MHTNIPFSILSYVSVQFTATVLKMFIQIGHLHILQAWRKNYGILATLRYIKITLPLPGMHQFHVTSSPTQYIVISEYQWLCYTPNESFTTKDGIFQEFKANYDLQTVIKNNIHPHSVVPLQIQPHTQHID